MSIRNNVQLVGNLGANPEIKNFESGSMLANFRIATNENYQNPQGEWQTETSWHNVVAWGPLAERVQKQLSKGSYVMLQGKLTHRDYTTSAGDKRYITEIKMNSFMLLDKNRELPSSDPALANSVKEDDDLPF